MFDNYFTWQEYDQLQYYGVRPKIDFFGISKGTDMGIMHLNEETGIVSFFKDENPVPYLTVQIIPAFQLVGVV
jgi:hypothetical protein